MKIKKYTNLTPELVEEVITLDSKIFPEPLTKEGFIKEAESKKNLSVFIAYNCEESVAFKVGFERSKRIYYSWIGGVLPGQRNKGIAKELMREQHSFAKDLGYKVVSTQTDNSFKSMIILNLKSGFEIRGTLMSTNDNHLTIIMEKDLES